MTEKIRVTFDGSQYAILGLPLRLSQKSRELLDVTLARGLSLKTARAYAYDLATFFRWHSKQSRPFSKLEERTLIQYLKFELDSRHKPATVNRKLNSIQVFFRFCYNRPIANAMPAGKSMRFLTFDRSLGIFPVFTKRSSNLRVRIPDAVVRPLDNDEVKAFFKTLTSSRNQAICSLMLFCGLRSEEVLLMRLSDIDHINATFIARGKGKRERILPLPDFIAHLLRRYREYERSTVAKTDLMFVSLKGKTAGKPLKMSGLRSLFRHHRIKSGVSRANPHRFRHTFGRDLAVSGVPAKAMQELFGHSDYRTTARYSRLNIADIHEEHAKALSRQKHVYDPSAAK